MSHATEQNEARPRVGFLGLGWIGFHRLQAIAATGLVDIVALADPDPEAVARARSEAPHAEPLPSVDALLAAPLDGVVIATPSALHAEHAEQALERGLAVFCQKPLAGSASAAARVVSVAHGRNLLLGVDMSYTHAAAFRAVAELVWAGALGQVFAVDLVFHNAYGPDKPWYYDRRTSGGGALIDLGVHLVDLALWTLGGETLRVQGAQLYAQGRPWGSTPDQVEDYGRVLLQSQDGTGVSVTCSWRAPAGCDAVIGMQVFGTKGGARAWNVGGSFYDFVAERFTGTRTEPLVAPPDDWGGRAAAAWVAALAARQGFDAAITRHAAVLDVLDRVYSTAQGGAA